MDAIPADIFTEPAEVDPDTLANLGPLLCDAAAAKDLSELFVTFP